MVLICWCDWSLIQATSAGGCEFRAQVTPWGLYIHIYSFHAFPVSFSKQWPPFASPTWHPGSSVSRLSANFSPEPFLRRPSQSTESGNFPEMRDLLVSACRCEQKLERKLVQHNNKLPNFVFFFSFFSFLRFRLWLLLICPEDWTRGGW